jgi:transcriptional regulator with XRE-family HTH domain
LGVSQELVAERTFTSQTYISSLERARDEIISEHAVLEILDAIDAIAAERAEIVAQGEAEAKRAALAGAPNARELAQAVRAQARR